MSKVEEVIDKLQKNYPDAKFYLNFSTPFELFIASLLSPQVRDEVVNATTPKLFKKYKKPEDYLKADFKELVNDIKPISFAGIKARRIKSACKVLVERFKGKVPENMEDLVKIPGIGRKTANTILINAFNKVEGIPVDTHVQRISYRLGWTNSKNADEIEKDLMKTIPKKYWKNIAYLLKAHGRKICLAPTPICSKCFLKNLCPKNGVKKHL